MAKLAVGKRYRDQRVAKDKQILIRNLQRNPEALSVMESMDHSHFQDKTPMRRKARCLREAELLVEALDLKPESM